MLDVYFYAIFSNFVAEYAIAFVFVSHSSKNHTKPEYSVMGQVIIEYQQNLSLNCLKCNLLSETFIDLLQKSFLYLGFQK